MKDVKYQDIHHMEGEFIELIRQRLGIVIKDNNQDLHKKLLSACNHFKCSLPEYYNKIKSSLTNCPELEYLVSIVTIGETYFFRDKSQMSLLSDYLLPKIIKSKRLVNDFSIRIWSAGCSSGEEIYTIAMMLDEILPDIRKWAIHLLGTDVNVNVLRKAMKGEYTEWSMRSISDVYKERYFTRRKNNYILAQSIINMVNFDFLNLIDDMYPSMINNTYSQDLIICRNVLIYFDQKNIELLMYRMSKCLNDHAYLLLGSSDPVMLSGTGLTRSIDSPLLCCKSDEVVDKVPVSDTKINEINFEFPVKRNNKEIVNTSLPIFSETISKLPPLTSKDETLFNELDVLMLESRWQELISRINSLEVTVNNHAYLLATKALALANLGNTKEAIACAEASLKADNANSWAYYVLALSYSEMDNIQMAESSFRKALFHDHKFVICHFQFGLFLLRHKQKEIGYKSLTNALNIAKQCVPDEPVPYGNGLSYKRLSEILEKEIELYRGVEHHE